MSPMNECERRLTLACVDLRKLHLTTEHILFLSIERIAILSGEFIYLFDNS